MLFLKSALTYQTFANFLRSVLGSRDPWRYVCYIEILRMPYAILIGVLISFTALIPIF